MAESRNPIDVWNKIDNAIGMLVIATATGMMLFPPLVPAAQGLLGLGLGNVAVNQTVNQEVADSAERIKQKFKNAFGLRQTSPQAA